MTEAEIKKASKHSVPNAEEFTRVLGQVTWLMTQSSKHKLYDLTYIEAHVVAPLMFKQVRVFTKAKQPIAALIWAYASPELQRKVQQKDYVLNIQDWRSGEEVVVVDCISPFVDGEMFISQFMDDVEIAKANKAK